MSALNRIEWPAEGQHRVRKIISRSRALPTGKNWSATLVRSVHWESEVECHGHVLADACPAISDYREQPCKVHYRDRTGSHTHVPDLYLDGALPRPWLIEFKSDDDPALEAAMQRAAVLRQPLLDAGIEYHVVLGSSIRHSVHLQNARLILRYARGLPNDLDVASAARTFGTISEMSLGSYLGGQTKNIKALQSLYRLLFGGFLTTPPSELLTDQTLLTWHGRPSYEEGVRWLRAAFALTR